MIGTFCALYLRSIGCKEVKIFDISTNVMTDRIFQRMHGNENWDAIFVCSNSCDGLAGFVENANLGVDVSIIGETQLKIDRSLLELKGATVRFCNSFGSGRGQPSYEIYNIPPSFRPDLSVQVNLADAIQLIIQNQDVLMEMKRVIADTKYIDQKYFNILEWDQV